MNQQTASLFGFQMFCSNPREENVPETKCYEQPQDTTWKRGRVTQKSQYVRTKFCNSKAGQLRTKCQEATINRVGIVSFFDNYREATIIRAVGNAERMSTQTSGTKQRAWKWTHTIELIVGWTLTFAEEQRQFNRDKIVFLTSGARITSVRKNKNKTRDRHFLKINSKQTKDQNIKYKL